MDNESIATEDKESVEQEPGRLRSPSRRTLMGGAALSIAAGALAGGGTAAAMTRDGSSTLTVDVACLGPTLRITAVPALANALPGFYGTDIEPGHLHGSPFAAEGLIFEGGTIAGDGFVPEEENSIGSWFCRGFFINGPSRPSPHMSTDQNFHFGALTFDSGIGNDLLITSGLEGANEETWTVNRAVTGGTGRYLSARGACRQTQTSRNATVFANGNNAPNFRFEFKLTE